MTIFDASNISELEHSAEFIEGAILAANLSPVALTPHSWLQLLGEVQDQQPYIARFELQYVELMRQEYDLLALLEARQSGLSLQDQLADCAEGFMTVWPVIETQWQQLDQLNDGTVRMMQGLLTTMMLAIDEETTQQQMRQVGIDTPPSLAELSPQLSLMLHEVAAAADAEQQGNRAQSVNPYKEVGRNDPCPCRSNKKFKHCCGK